MLMARVVVVRVTRDQVVVSLSLPPGFDVEKIEGDSLRANDRVAAADRSLQPRRERASDLFRDFQVAFPRRDLESLIDGRTDPALHVTGRLDNGASFSGWCPAPNELASRSTARPLREPGAGHDASGRPSRPASD